MTKKNSALVIGFGLGGLLIGMNAAAAVDVRSDITGALGAILLTNIALVFALIFQAGTSLQRLKQVEERQKDTETWQGEHEKWADGTVRELRDESGERANRTERRLSDYQRADVLAPQLSAIFDRLGAIERELKTKT